MGEITEAAALEKIRDVQRRVEEFEVLLAQSGRTEARKPLSKRYEKIMAVPVHASEGTEAVELREALVRAFGELDAILDEEFRVGVAKADSADDVTEEV